MTSPGAIIRRSTPRWCRPRAGRPPRRVRGRSGSTRRRRPAVGVTPETPRQALRGRHPRLKGHPVTVPVHLSLRLRGRRRPATGGRMRRESRRLAAAGTAPRPGPRASTGAAVRQATGRAVTSAVVPGATGRRVTGAPPPRGRRLGMPGPFPPVRRLAPVGRSRGASQCGATGGRRLLRVRPVTGVLVPRVKCPGTVGPSRPAGSPVTAGLPSRARFLVTACLPSRARFLVTAGLLSPARFLVTAGRCPRRGSWLRPGLSPARSLVTVSPSPR